MFSLTPINNITQMSDQNQFMFNQDKGEPHTEDIAIQTEKPKPPSIPSEQKPKQQPASEADEDEQMDKVDIAALIPKVSNREKLIEQNIKLKTQIYQLAQQIDEITKKSKQGKQQKEEDPLLKSKRLQLKKHEIKLMHIRNKIFNVKHQIETYDMLNINSLENKIKSVKLQIEQNQQQKISLEAISKGQTLAMGIQIPKQIEQKCNQNKNLIRQLREKHKTTHTLLIENQRIIRKNHEQVVIKSARIKDMEQKIALKGKQKDKERGRKIRSKSSSNRVSQKVITKLEEEVELMQKQKKQSDKVWMSKIKVVEAEIFNKRQQQEKKALILKEKEKQLKLYQLKLKQLNRFLKPIESKKDPVDTSQFKFKRNIRYIEK